MRASDPGSGSANRRVAIAGLILVALSLLAVAGIVVVRIATQPAAENVETVATEPVDASATAAAEDAAIGVMEDPGTPSEPVRLTTGRVLEADGVTPAHGLNVYAYGMDPENRRAMPQYWTDPPDAVTDEEGRFDIKGLKDGRYTFFVNEMTDAVSRSLLRRGKQHETHVRNGILEESTILMHERVRITGRAINGYTGEPLAGIRFSDFPVTPANEKVVESDEEGRFSVLTPDSNSGVIVYYYSDDGWLYSPPEPYSSRPGTVALPRPASTEPPPIDLVFEKGAVVEGVVVNQQTRAPVAGAQVVFRRGTDQYGFVWNAGSGFAPEEYIQTKDDGRFRFVLPPATYTFEAMSSDTYGRLVVSELVRDETNHLTLLVEETSSIEGFVIDEEGEPVSDVKVVLTRDLDGRADRPFRWSITGEDGAFHLVRLIPDEYALVIAPDDAGRHGGTDPLFLELEAGEKLRDIPLLVFRNPQLMAEDEILNFVEGTVYDEEDNPLAGVTVRPVYRQVNVASRLAQTDKSGQFHLPSINTISGFKGLTLMKRGFYDKTITDVELGDTAVTAQLKRMEPITIEVVYAHSGAPVHHFIFQINRLVEHDGTSSVHAESFIEPRKVHGSFGPVTIEPHERSSSPLGDLHLEVLALELGQDGEPLQLMGSTTVSTSSESGHDIRVRVELEPGRTVHGRVVMRYPEDPVAGATVTLTRPAVAGLSRYHVRTLSRSNPPQAITASDGSFVLDGVLPGVHRFEVIADGLAIEHNVPFRVNPGEDPPPATIRMINLAAIYGRVIGYDGLPIPGIAIHHTGVALSDPYGGATTSPTVIHPDESGFYRIEGVIPGSHVLTLADPSGNYEGKLGSSYNFGRDIQLDFDFSTAVRMSGLMLLHGNGVSSDDGIAIHPAGNGALGARLLFHGNGRYEARVTPGRYRLTAPDSFTGRSVLVEEFDVVETQDFRRDFDLRPPSISVVLVFPEDAEFAPGRITVVSDIISEGSRQERHWQPQVTSHSGWVHGVPEGTHRFLFESLDQRWKGDSGPVTISAGDVNYVTIEPVLRN